MAGNNLLHMLRGSAVNATTILDPGQPFYNLIKNYVTVGGKDADGNGVTPINGKPVAARELVGYVGDTDSAIGNNTTELYKIAYTGDALKFLISGGEKFAITAAGATTDKILAKDANSIIGTESLPFKEIYGSLYGGIAIKDGNNDLVYKSRFVKDLDDRGVAGYLTICKDSANSVYGSYFDTISDDNYEYFGYNNLLSSNIIGYITDNNNGSVTSSVVTASKPATINLGNNANLFTIWGSDYFTSLQHTKELRAKTNIDIYTKSNYNLPRNIFKNISLGDSNFKDSAVAVFESHCCFNSFIGLTSRKALILPDSTTTIQDYAFSTSNSRKDANYLVNENIKSVYIPQTVDYLGLNALPTSKKEEFYALFRHAPTIMAKQYGYDVNNWSNSKLIYLVTTDSVKDKLIESGQFEQRIVALGEDNIFTKLTNQQDIHLPTCIAKTTSSVVDYYGEADNGLGMGGGDFKLSGWSHTFYYGSDTNGAIVRINFAKDEFDQSSEEWVTYLDLELEVSSGFSNAYATVNIGLMGYPSAQNTFRLSKASSGVYRTQVSLTNPNAYTFWRDALSTNSSVVVISSTCSYDTDIVNYYEYDLQLPNSFLNTLSSGTFANPISFENLELSYSLTNSSFSSASGIQSIEVDGVVLRRGTYVVSTSGKIKVNMAPKANITSDQVFINLIQNNLKVDIGRV